jgi:hypothetical protein
VLLTPKNIPTDKNLPTTSADVVTQEQSPTTKEFGDTSTPYTTTVQENVFTSKIFALDFENVMLSLINN